MTEPRKIYLATIDTSDGERLAVPPGLLDNADPEVIRAALEVAEIAKAEAARRESEALARLFHLPDRTKAGRS